MASIQEYKCPACGGALEFSSELQKMKCPYCDSEYDMDVLKALDADLADMDHDDLSWQTPDTAEWSGEAAEGMHSYVCESCGGEIIGDDSLAATACPFCGNPVVLMHQFAGQLLPDCIIPFKLNKENAMEAYRNHIKGRSLLPKLFARQNHIDEIKGVYVPFWLYDADVDASLLYRATRVRTWNDSSYNYTETSYYSIKRSGSIAFDNIPVDGSTKIADDITESIEPFDLNEAVDFQTAYLSGYLADKYDVSSDDSIARANERITASTIDCFAKTVTGYSTVTNQGKSIRLANGKSKYALMPVWLLNTTYKGKKYTFAMNGQTGKLVGDLPVDKGAYWKQFGIFAAVFSVLFGLISWLFFT